MSISGLNTGGKTLFQKVTSVDNEEPSAQNSPTFARRYIDNNLFSFYHHTSLNATSFPTSHGRNVSATIALAREALRLDRKYGCTPKDLWTHRAPYPSESSIFTWLEKQVLPDTIHDEKRGNTPAIVLINTGAIRFDIFEGAFTVDTTYAVSPFTNYFHYIQDVPFDIAKKVLVVMNNEDKILSHEARSLQSKVPVSLKQQELWGISTFSRLKHHLSSLGQILFGNENSKLLPGYTTVDDGGSDGDDTRHSHIKFYRVPNCVESRIGFASCSMGDDPLSQALTECEDPKTVDLVFFDFIKPYVLAALTFLGTTYDEGDIKAYMEGTDITSLITTWVEENWKGEC